ncbi:hypothetical protein BDR04DRAFT_1010944 [Suillus decipiens]|nr:hypothetical protein BDR04DRAFT_1010944 [Suillus decipiens]
MASLAKQRDDEGLNFTLTVRWILGHKDVEGNKLADSEAKKAAERKRYTSPRDHLPCFLCSSPLPATATAIRQWHQTDLDNHWSTM